MASMTALNVALGRMAADGERSRRGSSSRRCRPGEPCTSLSSRTICVLVGRRARRRSGANLAASAGSSVCCRQLLRPVEREVEVAAPVVELVHLARRRPVLVQHRARRAVERVGEQLRGGVVGGLREELERRREREELAERVPPQVVLLHELLHVLRRRPAGARLEQPAAVHERHDREHLGAGAELEDREQVGEVVAQHVAGDRDGVFAAADPLERVPARVGGRHDLDGQPGRCRARAGTAAPWR